MRSSIILCCFSFLFLTEPVLTLTEIAGVDPDLLEEIFGTGGGGYGDYSGDLTSVDCLSNDDCQNGGSCDVAAGVCRCQRPYTGNKCQECESCVNAATCAHLFECVQCASLNYFWADEDGGSDLLSLSECPQECEEVEYSMVEDMPTSLKPVEKCLKRLMRDECSIEVAPPDDNGIIAHTDIKCDTVESIETEEGEYFGEVSRDCGSEDPVPNGFGTLTYYYDDVRKSYTGTFACGVRNGRGRLEWADDAVYSGDFDAEGQRTGVGAMVYGGKGHRYVGEWQNGTRHGQGVFYGSSQVYVGGFSGGERDGQGEIYLTSGDLETPVFEGEFSGGVRVNGRLEDPETGAVYEGGFSDGKFAGLGSYRDSCNNTYNGDWDEGKRWGFGNFSWTSGQSYEGNWEDGERSGEGVFVWNNLERYEGSFASDLAEGRGVFHWMDGSTFTGEFSGGVMVAGEERPPFDVRNVNG